MDNKCLKNPYYNRVFWGQSLNRSGKAFTLAETLIVLVILGVVAAITIPALVRNQMEAQNRTRIRKAMTVYDTAINKMVVENGIKSNEALIQFGNNNECANTKPYFKVSQEDENNCIFRSSDGVWWNIEDITHPIVSFDFDDLNKADEENNKAFKLVGYLDDNGILRVEDLGTATDDNKVALTKLYNFVNNKKTTEVVQNSTPRLKKVCNSNGICKEYDERGNWINGCSFDTPECIYNGVYDSNNKLIEHCESEYNCSYYTYDENGNQTAFGSNCTGTDISSCSYVLKSAYTYDDNGNPTVRGDYCTGSDISSCSYKAYYTYDDNGNKTFEASNCKGTDISSCTNKYSYTYDDKGNNTAFGLNCTGTDISSCRHKYLFTYDNKGNKTVQATNCTGSDISSCSYKQCYTYDENGNQTASGSNCTGTDISSCSDVTTYTNEYWDD